MTNHYRTLIAAAVSGILSYVSVEILNGSLGVADIGDFFPGTLFGAIVLAPKVAANQRRRVRQLALVIGSTFIYYLAFKLAVFQALSLHLPSSLAGAVSGMTGALVTVIAARYLLPLDLAPRTLFRAILFGALGGAVLGIPTGGLDLPKFAEIAQIALGFIVWQVGVTYSLFLLRTPG